jgi:hypothetical protein
MVVVVPARRLMTLLFVARDQIFIVCWSAALALSVGAAGRQT